MAQAPANRSAIGELRARRREEREVVDTHTAIMNATEALLATESMHNLNVAQLMAAAQVSRATFYSYFESKYDVVAALLSRSMDQMFERLMPVLLADSPDAWETGLRNTLENSLVLWREHQAVFRTSHENWPAVPELARQWLVFVEKFTDALVAMLQAEVDRGRARPVTNARQRCAAVLWASDRLIYVATVGVDPDIADDGELIETLMDLWTGTLFGTTA